MWQEILKAIPVFLFSSLKFIFGPTMGYAAGLNWITTFIATVGGMMAIVVLITYCGDWFKKHIIDRFVRKRLVPKPTSKFGEFMKRVLVKYGMTGVAFFTPLFLTPIGGTILAVSLGKPPKTIILYMLVSAISWAMVFTLGIYFFLDQVKDWIELVK